MELYEGLLTRRSVRQFIPDRDIPAKDIEDLLRAAMYAPSGRNTQPWEFIVVDDKMTFPKIIQIHPYCRFLEEASLAIIICGNTEKEMAPGAWMVDCANAAENLLLAAHAKNMGACWCGIYPDQERMNAFGAMFKLPEHIRPLGMIAIGYPAVEPKSPSDRYEESKVHHNQW